ncbi:MAG: 3-phosphoglycerate dehydrogenase [Peptostreptococcaceae bacterium]|nr:3-phosphoglycerate dehydrogenase [Peptostreptococcaceae bacterium]MDY5739860.1 3-phosphoglycerate dehydrogenase [Anaerovoracaceae bacterium]SFE46882.1 D-3-phosphoglycerate dehydrogenase [Peptostreptococcaceae bacterium pGA-8]
MYKIATLNKISPVGLSHLTGKYSVSDDLSEATGVLVRSQDLHSAEFPKELLGIARAGAGVNNIPLDRCAENGIVVFNTPGANANAVKELVIGSLILSARNVFPAMTWASGLTENIGKSVEKGKGQFAGTEIAGKKLAVIGLGAIGVRVANAAKDMGMRVIGYDPYFSVRSAHSLYSTIEFTQDLKAALADADYITLHLPAIDSTKEMFNKELIALCKPGAVLLNFARNLLVKEDDLLEALSEGKIKGYVTDFPTEGLLGKEGVLSIPHLGASTAEAEDNCATMATLQLMDYIENGNITNSVNFPNADLGPVAADESRIAVMTYGVERPVQLAMEMFKDLDIEAAVGGVKGQFGYALISSKTFVEEVNVLPGVVKVRVIQDM